MFLKIFLTHQQLTSLHTFLEGDALRPELANMLCCEPNERQVDILKEHIIQIKVAEYRPAHGTYTVEVEIEEAFDIDSYGHIFVPMSVLALLMSALLRFPTVAQPIYGKQGKISQTSSLTQMKPGMTVSQWGGGSGGKYCWGGSHVYNVSHTDDHRVYLVEAEHDIVPDSLKDTKDACYYSTRREIVLAELARRGVDYFVRAEFKIHP